MIIVNENKKNIALSNKELQIVQGSMLQIHKEMGRDLVSQDEDEIKDFESVMEELELKEGKDFDSLLPDYRRLFP
jgi:hypothetical protein